MWPWKQKRNRRRPHQERFATTTAVILLGMYVVIFFVSFVAPWLSPGNTILSSLAERWLVALTPLVGIVAHRYLNQRKGKHDQNKQE